MKVDNYNLRIQSTINNFTDLLYANSNVIGFARGSKMINGMDTDVQALKIYVEKKLSKSSIPERYMIPKYINGVLTDVEELAEQKFFRNEKRPAMSGDSIGNADYVGEGTITYAVKEAKYSANLFILSCAHVLSTEKEFRIIQPGNTGGGERPTGETNGDKSYIASLWVNPPLKTVKTRDEVKAETSNKFDAALARIGFLKEESARKNLVSCIRRKLEQPICVKGTVSKEGIQIGTPVLCVGAKSGVVKGKIKSFNFCSYIKRGSEEFIGFIDQIQVEIKCKPGDSGALGIIDDGSNRAFGMLVGGDAESAMFTPIDTVLSSLQIQFLD